MKITAKKMMLFGIGAFLILSTQALAQPWLRQAQDNDEDFKRGRNFYRGDTDQAPPQRGGQRGMRGHGQGRGPGQGQCFQGPRHGGPQSMRGRRQGRGFGQGQDFQCLHCGNQKGMRGRGQGRGPGQDQGFQEPHRQGPRRGPGQGPMILRALRHLDLTTEQHDQIKTIMDSDAEGAKVAHEAVRVAQQAFHETVFNEASEEDIRAAANALAEAMTKGAWVKIGLTNKIKKVLTEGQIQDLAELKDKVQQQREQRAEKPEEKCGCPRCQRSLQDGPGRWQCPPNGRGQGRGYDR